MTELTGEKILEVLDDLCYRPEVYELIAELRELGLDFEESELHSIIEKLKLTERLLPGRLLQSYKTFEEVVTLRWSDYAAIWCFDRFTKGQLDIGIDLICNEGCGFLNNILVNYFDDIPKLPPLMVRYSMIDRNSAMAHRVETLSGEVLYKATP